MKAEKLFEGIGYMDDKWLSLAGEPVRTKKPRHFVLYEIKKISGVKYIWVFMLALLILNTFAAWYTAGKTPAANEPARMISDFFDLYSESPAELDAYYAEIQEFDAAQETLVRDAIRAGDPDFVPESLPDIYSSDPGFSDKQLFSKLYAALGAEDAYREKIGSVIVRAKENLSAYSDIGINENSFAWKYQNRVITLYEKARDEVTIESVYTHGWDEYFSYDTVNVFIFATLLTLCAVIFSQENQTGFFPIMRASKYGRVKTAAAKIITALIMTFAVVMSFTLSSFAVYGLRIGFSGDNALQSLETFTLSPYRISIFGYLAASVGIKLLAFSVFSLTIIALSAALRNQIIVCLSGLAFLGLNLILSRLHIEPLDLISSASVTPIFERYRAVNVFGNAAGVLPTLIIGYTLVLLFAAVLTIVFHAGGIGEIRPAFIDSLISDYLMLSAKLRNRLSRAASKHPRRERVYSSSLVLAEVFKTLISSRFIVVVVLILAVKVCYSYKVNRPSDSYADAVYKEYMTKLSGELTDEKLGFIVSEREMINETLDKKTSVEREYKEGRIGFDDYRAFLSDYNYAYSRSKLFSVIEKHALYLQNEEAATGIRGQFVYDTGWKKLYSEGADLFLYASILLLMTGTFAAEYASGSSKGGFIDLLRSTKNGRRKTFTAKLVSSGIIALILSLAMNAIDAITIISGYELPLGNAPLCSIEMFSGAGGGITIAGYSVIFFSTRTLGALIMSMLVCALSELLAKYIPILGTAIALTLLPALCAYFGLAAAERLNFLNLLAGTPLFIESSESALFGNSLVMLTLWLIAAAAAVAALLFPARKMFTE